MKEQENNQDNLEQIKEDEATKEAVNKEDKVESVEFVKEELQKEKDKFLRLFAEFENYKRRTAKERLELFATASEEVMTALLPVIDDFEDRKSTRLNSSHVRI